MKKCESMILEISGYLLPQNTEMKLIIMCIIRIKQLNCLQQKQIIS